MDHATVVGRELQSLRRGRERLAYGEHMGKRNPHGNWLGKQEGMNIMSSCNQWSLKPGVLKSFVLTGLQPISVGAILDEKAGKQLVDI